MTTPTPQTGPLFQGNLGEIDPTTPVGRLVRSAAAGAVSVPGRYRPMAAEDVKTAEELQAEQTCRWCGGLHARACPRVKRLSYDPTGQNVTEVEFWPADQWSDAHVVWPEDLVKKDGDDADGGS